MELARDYLTQSRNWDGAYHEVRALNASEELRLLWLIPETDLEAVASDDLIMKLGRDGSFGLLIDLKNRSVVGEYTSAEVLETVWVYVSETRDWPETYYEVKLTPMAGEWLHLWIISKAASTRARERIAARPGKWVQLGGDGESFGLYIDPRTRAVTEEYVLQ
jgi:hypothetical protein